MQIEVSASIYIRNNKAHVVSIGDCEISFVVTEPMYTVDLNDKDIAEAVKKIFKAGTPKLLRPPENAMSDISAPLLKEACVKDWDELAQNGRVYNVIKYPQEIVVLAYKFDAQGEMISEKPQKTTYNGGTNMRKICRDILADVNASQPETQTDTQPA